MWSLFVFLPFPMTQKIFDILFQFINRSHCWLDFDLYTGCIWILFEFLIAEIWIKELSHRFPLLRPSEHCIKTRLNFIDARFLTKHIIIARLNIFLHENDETHCVASCGYLWTQKKFIKYDFFQRTIFAFYCYYFKVNFQWQKKMIVTSS